MMMMMMMMIYIYIWDINGMYNMYNGVYIHIYIYILLDIMRYNEIYFEIGTLDIYIYRTLVGCIDDM